MGAQRADEAVDGAAAVFVAAPVGMIAGLARQALAASSADCVVSDVGSSKCSVLAQLTTVERERFIGGHPICGSERGGVEHAREDLFAGATYFLTPAAEARPELFERLHGIVAATGARPSAIDPDVHDRLMALVSHLPHVIASALIHQAAATAPQGREALRSAGPSFTDLTRVAGANPPLWADILLANRDAVIGAIDDQVQRLGEVVTALGFGRSNLARDVHAGRRGGTRPSARSRTRGPARALARGRGDAQPTRRHLGHRDDPGPRAHQHRGPVAPKRRRRRRGRAERRRVGSWRSGARRASGGFEGLHRPIEPVTAPTV